MLGVIPSAYALGVRHTNMAIFESLVSFAALERSRSPGAIGFDALANASTPPNLDSLEQSVMVI